MKLTRLFVVTTALAGATAAHGAQTWTVTVSNSTTATLGCPDTSKLDTCLLPAGKTNAFDNGATITINCATPALCQAVTLSRENAKAPVSEVKGGATPSPGVKVYTLSNADLSGATNVGVFFQKNLLAPLTLQPTAAVNTDGGGNSSTGARTLEQVVAASNPIPLQDCPPSVQGRYSHERDDGDEKATAEMYVDVLGNVISSPSAASFDENDRLVVNVLGDEDLLQRLRVARTSDIRDVTAVRVVGEGQAAPSIVRQSRGAAACKMRTFDAIDSFAPGKGVVTISRVNANAVEAIGTVEVNVAALYSGMFTLGAARTEAVDPDFKLVTNGTDQVITAGDASDKDTVYSIYYTHFAWGKRDLEKPFNTSQWYKRINPTIGFVVDDVSNNFMAGISIDLPRGVVITAGRHYRKIEVLSKESGFSVGSVFTGAPETLPTSKSWESEKFIAVSVDIRIMAQLIRSAFTSTTN